MGFYKVHHHSIKSRARLGEIKTAHGTIKTPAFVAVGTKGTVKSLLPELLEQIGTQLAFVNTYHLVTHPGPEIIAKAGGIHEFAHIDKQLMSDSGGFQVFSLAREKRIDTNKKPRLHEYSSLSDGGKAPSLVKISEDGVKFRSVFDGTLIEFTPEKSMEYQRQIGADINMAFDECTYYPATHEYSEKAMERTHKWLTRCITYRKSLKPNVESHPQYLYGVIQGGTYEDLRVKSAKFVVAQNTPGVAIGGVSVGETKKEMRDQVRWVSSYLPDDRPVHLLGVGQIDDIIDLVGYGIDTFDCVEPTRIARMGSIYQMKNENIKNKNDILKLKNIGKIDVLKGTYRYNLEKVDEGCDCYVCINYTKAYLHHLFKQRELLGYTLATYHNLWVMEKLMESIRDSIVEDVI